jgi:hypothetical protein
VRQLAFVLAVVGLGLAFPATAGQARYPSLGGPLWVTIGKPVTLSAREFPAERRLSIALEHGRESVGAHPCCVSTVATHPQTDRSGNAIIRFTWPKAYSRAPSGRGRWRDSDIAIIYVVSAGWDKLRNPDRARATKVVYLRGP